MSYTEQTLEYKGYKIEIVQDDDSEDPRSWKDENTGPHMICWHRSYSLGDKHDYSEPIELLYELAELNRDDEQELREGEDISYGELYRLIEEKGHIIRTLGLLDHSGLHMYIGGRAHWTDPGGWDSGPVGYIYSTKEEIEKEKWTPEQANEYMEGEVETYDDWLRGNVYGYRTEDDSVWGYYGTEGIKQAVEDAKCAIDGTIRRKVKKHVGKVKDWIRNHVPLIYRKPLELV